MLLSLLEASEPYECFDGSLNRKFALLHHFTIYIDVATTMGTIFAVLPLLYIPPSIISCENTQLPLQDPFMKESRSGFHVSSASFHVHKEELCVLVLKKPTALVKWRYRQAVDISTSRFRADRTASDLVAILS